MIPEFDKHGYLPHGIHPATLSEIEQRFGHEPELRRVQFDSIRWMIELAIKAGVLRIIINGSYVTDVFEPNDVDCVLLVEADFPDDKEAERQLREGLPFLDIEMADRPTFDFYCDRFYATDRLNVSKGLIEVLM